MLERVYAPIATSSVVVGPCCNFAEIKVDELTKLLVH